MTLLFSQASVAAKDNPASASVSIKPTAPIIIAEKPITDERGRILYIVDLVEDPNTSSKPYLAEKAPAEHEPNKETARIARQALIADLKRQSKAKIDDVIKVRGIEPNIELVSSTHLVGTSFTAYLDQKQVERLAKDKRVERLTQNRYINPSSSGLWSDDPSWHWSPRSWGNYAMGGNYVGASIGTATIYVVDNGVEAHGALNLAEQIAVTPGVSPVGCYPHATHVAGIAGGSNNVGMLPGARIVSISTATSNSGSCGSFQASNSTFAAALDEVYARVLAYGVAGVVNMSFNALGVFGQNDTVGIKMRKVAAPALLWPDWTWYPGALVVQSAGNENEDACLHAYSGTSTNDGILVVGGITRTGQTASPSTNTEPGLHNYTIAVDQLGTNHGSCVEVYAPASRIRSTWSNGGYQKLSGTSMAAPLFLA
jgi:Subtilase family